MTPNGELNVDVPGGPNIQGPFVGNQAMINQETSRFIGAAWCYGYWPYVTANNNNYYAMVLGWKAFRNDRSHCPTIQPCDYSSSLNLESLLGSSAIGQRDNTSRIVDVLPNEEDRPRLLGNGGGSTIYRMKEGIERFLITDINNPAGSAQAQSSVPIMMDSIAWTEGQAYRLDRFNHIPGGNNVLYMDGHVEFIRFVGGPQGRYPVNIYVATRRFGANVGLQ